MSVATIYSFVIDLPQLNTLHNKQLQLYKQ